MSEPCEGAFHFPASAIASELSTVLGGGFHATATVGTNQVPAFALQFTPQRVAIVTAIGNHLQGGFQPATFHRREGAWGKPDLRLLGRRNPACQRDALAIHHQNQLRSLPAARESDVMPPFFAGMNVASRNSSSQSRMPCWSRVSRKAENSASRTPSCSHWTNRLQQVLAEGKPAGKSLHRAPVFNTQRMPSKQSRSATRGLPPRGRARAGGRNGSIRNHCSSLTIRGRGMMDSFPTEGVSEVTTKRKVKSTRI